LAIAFNTILHIIDFVIVLVKFLYAIIFETYVALTNEERDVSGDIVLITGTGHGIGKELALQYSALGATVVCWDINEKLNLETVNLIKSKGKKAFAYT
jgi:all-trans-retinol dehydrogenase (NAD+)